MQTKKTDFEVRITKRKIITDTKNAKNFSKQQLLQKNRAKKANNNFM